MRRRRGAYSIILAAVLASSLPASACTGMPGCGDDFSGAGSYYRDNADAMKQFRDSRPDDYRTMRDHYPDGPPQSTAPSRPSDERSFNGLPPSSAPSMWNQFGPDGKMHTCQRSFNTVYCN